jgi:LysM repeat protein
MKKIFFLLFILPIFAFAQTKPSKNTVAKPKPTTKPKPVVKDKQPPKAKPVVKANPVVKAKPVVKTKPEVKPVAKAKPETKPVVKAKPITKGKPKAAVEPKETLKATMHTVGPKETLYGIGRMYGAKVDELKRWNKLTTDDLVEGMELIVGFGKVTKIETIKEITGEPTTPVIEEPVVKSVPKKTTNPKLPEVKTEVVEPTTDELPTEGKNFNGGFFKSLYKDNGKVLEGTAGIFKSTSGWDDGKYYCLHNTAKQGTIIKVINVANGKSIYAKVLDIMPDLKQNDKLIIRISSAAADALGETTASSMNVAIAY